MEPRAGALVFSPSHLNDFLECEHLAALGLAVARGSTQASLVSGHRTKENGPILKAARTGRRDSEVIEAALWRDLGLDLLERVWESADLDEDEALRLGVEAQHETRRV